MESYIIISKLHPVEKGRIHAKENLDKLLPASEDRFQNWGDYITFLALDLENREEYICVFSSNGADLSTSYMAKCLMLKNTERNKDILKNIFIYNEPNYSIYYEYFDNLPLFTRHIAERGGVDEIIKKTKVKFFIFVK